MDLTLFNPGSQAEADFLASFVARSEPLHFFHRQLLLQDSDQPARAHLIVAPRGFGKTSLLRRIAIAIRSDSTLSERFIALSFREEQHNVISLDIFWRNCMQSLVEAREDEGATVAEVDKLDALWARHAPRQGLKRDAQDGDPVWRDFHNECKRLGRRPILLLDNLDALLSGLPPEQQWALRRILQGDDGPIVIAAAARYPDSVHDPSAAFYEFFAIHTLDKLSDREVMRCLRSLAQQRGEAGRVVVELLDKDPGRVSALNALAGGNPRTLSVLYQVLESHLSTDVLSQLSAMLDTFTGWYQARTEELPLQSRAVFDALALNWDPMTAARVGEVTGLDTTAVSSQISRLERAGYVEAVPMNRRGTGRNGYQLSERFFNVWYLMRNGPRRTRQSIKFLTVFLQSCFNLSERRAMAQDMLMDGCADPKYGLALAGSVRNGMLRQRLLDLVKEQSSRLGLVEEYDGAIQDLRNRARMPSKTLSEPTARGTSTDEPDADVASNGVGAFKSPPDVARVIFERGVEAHLDSRLGDALIAYDEVIQRFDTAPELALQELLAGALVNKSLALGAQGRGDDALAACDAVVERFGTAPEPVLREAVARALVSKGFALGQQGRADDALGAYDAVVERCGTAAEPALQEQVAWALVNKGVALRQQGRTDDALAAYDAVVERFGTAAEPALQEQVAKALVNKGVALRQQGRNNDARAAYDAVVKRFGTSPEPGLLEPVARALVDKGVTLGQQGRADDALGAYDAVVEHFGTAAEPALREQVARALVNKGVALGQQGRADDALAAYDAVAERFAAAAEPALQERVARALVNKGVALGQQGRADDAIAAYNAVAKRFGTAPEPALRTLAAKALVNKGFALRQQGRADDALAAYDAVAKRFGAAPEPALRAQVARALINKGVALSQHGRTNAALAAYDAVVERFGTSPEPALRTQVARALINKGVALGQEDRGFEAVAAYEDAIKRLGDSRQPSDYGLVHLAFENHGSLLLALGRLADAEQSLRRAAMMEELPGGTSLSWMRLGNLLLDHKGDWTGAVAAYQAGLSNSTTARIAALLHANCAYVLGLHTDDTNVTSTHADAAVADGFTISTAGRHLLNGLIAVAGGNGNWRGLFEAIDQSLGSGDSSLWSAYLDDLQRLLAVIVSQGQGETFREWMDHAQYEVKYAPFYHAVVAAIDGDDHLVRINPEMRRPAEAIYEGIGRLLRLYPGRRTTKAGRR